LTGIGARYRLGARHWVIGHAPIIP